MKDLSRSKGNLSPIACEPPLSEGESHKCECCSKERFGCEWQEIGKYWLCLACKERVQARRAGQLVEKEIQRLDESVIVDEKELKGLRADGLMPLRTYIYFAMRIDGVTDNPKTVDLLAFCDRWAVTKEDLLSAVASLSKKGCIYVDISKLTTSVFTHEDRLSRLESAVKE